MLSTCMAHTTTWLIPSHGPYHRTAHTTARPIPSHAPYHRDARTRTLYTNARASLLCVVRTHRDMMTRMTGKDDWGAMFSKWLSYGTARGHGRSLALAMGGIKGDLPRAGCDGGDLGTMEASLEKLMSCAHRVQGELGRAGEPSPAIFAASDSSSVDRWFKATYPAIRQSEGVPVHTGRQVEAPFADDVTKVVVDFFVLSRASSFITNCPAESTFVANVQLLRDAHELPTYRGLSADGAPACAKMAAYPSHVHHLTGVARQADNIIQLAILACLAAAVAGLAAIYACFR